MSRIKLAVLLVLTNGAAYANPRYDALDDAAVGVKSASGTPLVAITRAGARLVAVGLHGAIIISDDNGITWRQAFVPVDVTLTTVLFTSKTEAWAAGHYGVILHSGDAGLTWTKLLDGRDVIRDLDDISRKAQSAAASSPNSELESRVAVAFEKAGPSKPFLTLGRCGNGLLAAGQQDMAMFSPDNGKTWQSWTSQIDNPSFQNIYGIVAAGNATLLIGESGLALESVSDCSGFRPWPGPYHATLFGGVSIDPRTIILYGLDGGVFKTNDAGATWRTIPMPADSVIDAGIIFQSNRVLLGTLDGTMYLSDPGGENFHQLAVNEPFQIADLAIAPNGNIITVGNGGVGIVASSLIR